VLNLTEKQRTELSHRHALTVDAEGDEVLLGLTSAESTFYLILDKAPSEIQDAGERAIFYRLKLKHLYARSDEIMRRSSALTAKKSNSFTNSPALRWHGA
jgi:hypothetical protein